MSTQKENLNTHLLDLLGIEWRCGDVLGVTLRLRAKALPTVVVHRQLSVVGLAPLSTKQRFVLTPLDELPYIEIGL